MAASTEMKTAVL
jgi:hypothetical protein